MSEKQEDKFKVNKITNLDELKENDIINTSDLALQWFSVKFPSIKDILTGKGIIKVIPKLAQSKFMEKERKKKKKVIKPGSYTMINTNSGVALEEVTFKTRDLLQNVLNTQIIKKSISQFFDNLDKYEEEEIPKQRGILLYSIPGTGKSASINEVCNEFLQQEGTVVIKWDTSKIRASSASDFYIVDSVFNKDVKRQFLIIEDIGGGSVDGYNGGVKAADSSLLNLLDGSEDPFKGIPTIVLATTNNPETQCAALINRTGRFDEVIGLNAPTYEECLALIEFKLKKTNPDGVVLTEEHKKTAKLASENNFSIADILEIHIRTRLTGKSYLEVTDELIAHKNKFTSGFSQTNSGGFGL